MPSFYNLIDEDLTGVAYKNCMLKKSIVSHFLKDGNATIADLCDELNLSPPKVNGLLNELIDSGYVKDYGKIDTSGGRRPNLFGLDLESGVLLGVQVKRQYINIGLTNLQKQIIHIQERVPYELKNTDESFNILISIIKKYIEESDIPKEKIISAGITLPGRINFITGYSYSFFNFGEEPLSKRIEQALGLKVYLENNTRAMALGEFWAGIVKNEKNVLFLNLDFGIGVGILINSKVYFGKSGFAGEFGHIPVFDNDIMCHCGKIGCLETEVSGWALIVAARKRLQAGHSSILSNLPIDKIGLDEIINAANNDDTMAIELIAELAEKLGKAMAILIDIFNPELVVLGGNLANTGEHLSLPVKVSLNKYALSLHNNDAQLKISKLNEKGGVLGVCLLARNQILALR